MPSVVVVQSGDLAAWVGAVSGLAGVVLGFGLESARRRRRERADLRTALSNAAGRIAFAGGAYRRAMYAAGEHWREQPWIDVIAVREDALESEVLKVGETLLANPSALWALRGHRAERQNAILDAARNFGNLCLSVPPPEKAEDVYYQAVYDEMVVEAGDLYIDQVVNADRVRWTPLPTHIRRRGPTGVRRARHGTGLGQSGHVSRIGRLRWPCPPRVGREQPRQHPPEHGTCQRRPECQQGRSLQLHPIR
jgi:hypothetical protein